MPWVDQLFTSVPAIASLYCRRREGDDSVDSRDVSDAKNGSGKIINNKNDVGGWPIYASSQPQPNHGNDGIADDWKKPGTAAG